MAARTHPLMGNMAESAEMDARVGGGFVGGGDIWRSCWRSIWNGRQRSPLLRRQLQQCPGGVDFDIGVFIFEGAFQDGDADLGGVADLRQGQGDFAADQDIALEQGFGEHGDGIGGPGAKPAEGADGFELVLELVALEAGDLGGNGVGLRRPHAERWVHVGISVAVLHAGRGVYLGRVLRDWLEHGLWRGLGRVRLGLEGARGLLYLSRRFHRPWGVLDGFGLVLEFLRGLHDPLGGRGQWRRRRLKLELLTSLFRGRRWSPPLAPPLRKGG
jgi:hypothetical protein